MYDNEPGCGHGYNPERGFFESGPERLDFEFESLDIFQAIERLRFILIEAGPELDPDYLRRLEDLLAQLNMSIDDPYVWVRLDDLRTRVDSRIGSEVSDVMSKLQLPPELRPVVEKIISDRREGLTDRAIYLRLARIYHPDQTLLDAQEAEEIFKLIGQLLYSESDATFNF